MHTTRIEILIYPLPQEHYLLLLLILPLVGEAYDMPVFEQPIFNDID